MNLSMTQKQTQGDGEQICGFQGRGGWEGESGWFGLADAGYYIQNV